MPTETQQLEPRGGTPLPQAHQHVGALIVGGDYQGLGIVRSLGALGVPLCVIDDEHSIARHSRYVTHFLKFADLRDPANAIAAVIEAHDQFGLQDWVVFPTRDETVAALSHHRSLLSGLYRVPTPDWDSVRWAWDKRNTHRMAADLGIPAPRTLNPLSVADLDKIDFDPPYVLKPAIKEHFFYKTKAKAWRADSRSELRDLFSLAQTQVQPGEILVQEYIPGDGVQQYAFCSFFKNGQSMGSMTVRRKRQHPHDFGRASTFVETVDEPVVEALATRYLSAMNYYGLAEVEFKVDTRDGQFKLHDVNTRTWGYHSLGVFAGVNFPAMLFADQLGLPVTNQRAVQGRKWVRLVTDIPASFFDIIKGRLSATEYVRSMRGEWTEAVFSAADPLPGLVEITLLPYLMYKRGF